MGVAVGMCEKEGLMTGFRSHFFLSHDQENDMTCWLIKNCFSFAVHRIPCRQTAVTKQPWMPVSFFSCYDMLQSPVISGGYS